MIYKTRTKALSFLLTLAMVIGLVPGMSLTAYAESYNNRTTYLSGEQRLSNVGAGSVISKNCTIYKNSGRGITIYDTDGTTVLISKGTNSWERFQPGYDIIISSTPGGVGTLTAKKCFICSFTSAPTAKENLTYNGTEQELINAGGSVTGGTMYYQLGENSSQVPTGEWTTIAPKGTAAGNYYVWYKAVASEDNYADYPATCVTATVSQKDVTVSSITAENKTYDGTTDATLVTTAATFDGMLDSDTLTVTATGAFENVNVGQNKTVTISDLILDGDSKNNYILATEGQQVSTTATITSKEIGLTWSNTELTYTGEAQKPMATATGLVDGDTCTVTVTGEETNVGDDYTATASALSNSNYMLPENKTTTFKISKATPSYTKPTDLTATYGQTLADVALPDGWSWNDEAATSVGNVGSNNFNATFTPENTDNYNTATESLSIAVSKAASSVKIAPTAKTLTYTGSAQELVTAGEATGGTLYYAVTTENTAPTDENLYTTSIPTGTDAGTYHVWYKVVGDTNHNDTDPVCVTVTISVPYVPSYSGGNDSSPSTPAATTITVPVSSDTQSVSVTASVSGETATVQKPTTAQLEQIVGESVHTGEVTIDVSGLGKEITTASIPTETVKAVEQAVNDAANDATGMTVKLSEGSVTFDGQALTAITEQATGSNIQLNLDDIGENKLSNTQQAATKDMDVQAVYDAYITSNGQRISDFKGGKATVTVPYELKAEQRAAGVTVWYVADNGNTTEMPSTYDGKEVKFTVEHFSNYVIAYDEERAAVCPQDATCPISAFIDADPTAWYHDGVHYVLENGIMSGLGNGQFAPNGTTSRAMLAQILYNMEGKPAIRSGIPFEDVSESDWYAMAISWAESNGIIGGYGNGKFGPNDDLTREQLVTIMYRYAKDKGIDVSVGEDTNILSYDDAFDVSEWAIPAMQWAVGNGLISGRTASTLNPKDKATRAEIATIIMRYCEEIAK